MTITPIPAPAFEVREPCRSVWRHGLAATAAAAGATTLLAAAAQGAGVTFEDRTGGGIPLVSFAELTLVFSLLGVALAAGFARHARAPRRTFLRTTGVLLLVSFVPDITVGLDAPSAATLIALHAVAAAIVVPTLAGRLISLR